MGAQAVKHGLAHWIVLAFAGAAAAALCGCRSGSRANHPATQSAINLARAQEVALDAQNAKKPEKAIELYQQAVTLYPEFASAWNNMGILLMDRDQYLEASRAFSNAAESAPTDPRPLYNLGLAWDRTYYTREAMKYYGLALERDRLYLPALRGHIRAERELGIADDKTLERLRLALGQEQDPKWRQYFELQKSAVEQELYRSVAATGAPHTDGPPNAGMYAAPPLGQPAPTRPDNPPR